MKKTMNMNSCTILMEDRYSRNPFCKRVVRGGFVLEAAGGWGNPRVFIYLVAKLPPTHPQQKCNRLFTMKRFSLSIPS